MPTTGSKLNLQLMNGWPAQMPITAAANDIGGSVVVNESIPTIAHSSHQSGQLIAGHLGRATYTARQTHDDDLAQIVPGPVWYRPAINALVTTPVEEDLHFGIALTPAPAVTTPGEQQTFLVAHDPNGQTFTA